jgi:1,4-dihydroxy-2-naphthoate polyprenyltransferase
MNRNKAQTILKSLRLPFLILTPACIFLAYCAALKIQEQINPYDLFLALLGALSAHISANTFNEYFDFRSGLDTKTTKTPFSGGSGALIDNPKAVNAVHYVAIASLITTILIGFYFIYRHGFSILPIGIVGVLIIVTYTQWINRYPLLCLFTPGVGFGLLMIVGTHVVLTGEYSIFSFFVSLVPFFLVNNLLLLNQYPDILADRSVGRRHFPIAYGVKISTILYGIFAAAVCLTIILGIFLEYFPKLSLIGLIPMSAALVAFFGAMKHARSVEKLIPYLGMNVLATVLTPILLGVSLIID